MRAVAQEISWIVPTKAGGSEILIAQEFEAERDEEIAGVCSGQRILKVTGGSAQKFLKSVPDGARPMLSIDPRSEAHFCQKGII